MEKLIDLHYKWKKQKLIPNLGLCNSIPDKYQETLDLFEPDVQEELALIKDEECPTYWGSGCKVHDPMRYHAYTLRRQYIVLFICAIHGEI